MNSAPLLPRYNLESLTSQTGAWDTTLVARAVSVCGCRVFRKVLGSDERRFE